MKRRELFAPSIMRVITTAVSLRTVPGSVIADFEDLFQEACIAVWKARQRFRGECSEETYAYEVAFRHCTGILATELEKLKLFPFEYLGGIDPNKAFAECDLFAALENVESPTRTRLRARPKRGPDRKPRSNRLPGERFASGRLKPRKVGD